MRTIVLLSLLMVTSIVTMPSLPPDIERAIYNLHDNKHYMQVREYIAAAALENLIVLDLLLNELTCSLETVKVFRFSYRNAIVGSIILGWGTCNAFAKSFKTLSFQNQGLVYPAKHEKAMIDQPSLRISLSEKFKAVFGSFGAWMIKKGIFVTILTALPSVFAEYNYYTHYYQEQEERILQLRYEIHIRQQEIGHAANIT